MAKFFKCPKAELTMSRKSRNRFNAGKPCEVTFPVSYRYNGGIVIKDKWYEGYKVPAPTIPKGYELRSLGVGLQLNAHPPYATMILCPIEKK